MKNRYILFLMLGILFLPISCQEKDAVTKKVSSTELIEQAHSGFEQHLLTRKQAKTASTDELTVRQRILKNALWDQAYVSNFEYGEAVVVPVMYQNDVVAINSNRT